MNLRVTYARAYRRFAVLAGGAALAAGCNAIFGIEEGHLVADGAGGSGGDESTGGASGDGGMQNPDAGDGGSDTGGASSGGRSTGGAATGGRGGAGGGGRGGAGGGAGAGGAAGSGGVAQPPGVPGEVHCGTENCTLPGQKCCVAKATAEAHCSTSCDPTSQSTFSCDGAEDCTGGAHCCLPFGVTDVACAATCSTGRILCGADTDCGPGQYCAPGTGALASVFVCTNAPASNSVWCGGVPCAVNTGRACCYEKTTHAEQCAATCGTNTIRFACDSDDDCAAGSSCCESHTGLGAATGTSCVAGGCPAGSRAPVACGGSDGCASGEFCCSRTGGTTCAAACSTSAACGTDADCLAGEACKAVTTTIDLNTGRHFCGAP